MGYDFQKMDCAAVSDCIVTCTLAKGTYGKAVKAGKAGKDFAKNVRKDTEEWCKKRETPKSKSKESDESDESAFKKLCKAWGSGKVSKNRQATIELANQS